MKPVFVLVPSPLVGPSTWVPVVSPLGRLGYEAVVASLTSISDGEPPYWPQAVEAARVSLKTATSDRRAVVVAHSNAGALAPVIATGLGERIRAVVLVDALVPGQDETELAGGPLGGLLDMLTEPDGRLRVWTEWFDESDVSGLFPDVRARTSVSAELPRLKRDYFDHPVPTPPGWDRCGVSYLRFSAAYRGEEAEARSRGWRTAVLAGGHLHQLVDPPAVAQALVDLAVH